MSSLLHLFAQPEPPHRLIIPCHRLKVARALRKVYLCLTIPFLLLFCMMILPELFSRSGVSPAPYIMLFSPLSFLFMSAFCSMQMRYWQRIEPWRFVASLGNERLLANEQPVARPAALPLSTTIKVRLIIERRLTIRFFSLLTFFVALFIFLVCLALFSALSLWPWALLIAVLVGGLFALGMFFLLRIQHSMEITEDGIRVRSTPGGFTTLIFWHELRLFACYPEPGVKNGDEAMVYELSSGSQVIYWTWMRKKSLLNTIMGPFMPLEEHNLQMHALCSPISAKTGLPLYDLSKGLALRLEEAAEAR